MKHIKTLGQVDFVDGWFLDLYEDGMVGINNADGVSVVLDSTVDEMLEALGHASDEYTRLKAAGDSND